MGKEIEIITDTQRLRPENSEVERLLADNSRAKHLLGWLPKYSGTDGFKKGLVKTIEWFTDQANFFSQKSDKYNI